MIADMTSPDPARLPVKEPRHVRTVRIPLSLDNRVKELADLAGISANEMFCFLVDAGIKDITRSPQEPQ